MNKKELRFALMFNEKNKSFFIMVESGIIYESIFKDPKTNKWTIGYALAAQASKKYSDGSEEIQLGVPHIHFLAKFREWTKATKGITIISEENNKKYELPQKDIEEIKQQIKLRDKRIKI